MQHPQQQPHQGQPQQHHQHQQQQQQALLPHPQMQHQQPGLLPHPQSQQQQGGFVQPPPGFQQAQPPQQFQHQQQPPQFMQQGPPPPHMQPQQQFMQQGPPQQTHFQQGPPPPHQSSSHSHSHPASQETDPFLQHVVSASLVDLLGKQILVLLRDGRKLIGELLSFDQYSNIVVSGASERKVVGGSYYDEPLGLYVIRGENVVLMGDQHPNRLAKHTPPIEFKPVTKAEFAALEAEEKKKNASGSSSSKPRTMEEDDLI